MRTPRVMLVYPCEECGSLAPVDDLCGAQIQEMPPDSLVIVKEDGEWPEWVTDVLASRNFHDYPEQVESVLDALAAAKPGRER